MEKANHPPTNQHQPPNQHISGLQQQLTTSITTGLATHLCDQLVTAVNCCHRRNYLGLGKSDGCINQQLEIRWSYSSTRYALACMCSPMKMCRYHDMYLNIYLYIYATCIMFCTARKYSIIVVSVMSMLLSFCVMDS